jgi:hypothetical protein
LSTDNAPVTNEALQKTVGSVKTAAMELVIAFPQDVEHARDGIREIKRRRDVINSHCDPGIKQAHALHKQLVGDKKKLTDELNEAERIIKRKVGDYQIECERIAREEQEKARLAAEAESKRQIEAARKKIEKALEKAGTIQEKIAAVTAVIEDEATSETELELAERQLEVLNLQLQGLNDQAQAAQEKAEDIAAAPAYIPPAAVVEKTKGVGVKKIYIITSIDNDKLIKAISEGKGSAALVKSWDETMLKKLAGMGIFLPGVAYQEDRSISVR